MYEELQEVFDTYMNARHPWMEEFCIAEMQGILHKIMES